jgi:hypothetical protein
MKKFGLLICVGLLFITSIGCSDSSLPQNERISESNGLEKRFVMTGEEYSGGFKIIIDKKTGVNYIFYEYGVLNQRSTAMTPLLDKEGNVVISKIENK